MQRLLRSGKLFRSDFRFAPSIPQRPRPAISSRWLSAAAPPASNIFPMALRRSAPAGNIFPMALRRNAPGQQQTSSGGEDLRFG
ncbi:MAG: hypothetical protein ACI3YW_00770 [Candidatus Egerieousia sp.]